MEEREIQQIFGKYLDGKANTDEIQCLCDYFGIDGHDDVLAQLIQKHLGSNVDTTSEAEQIASDRWLAIRQQTRGHSKVRRFTWVRYAAAAVFLICSVGLYFYIQSPELENVVVQQDILPGTNRATLSLSDGQTVLLNESQGLLIADKEGFKYNDGTQVANTLNAKIATITTPRGGQYRVTLSDGTKVWLNAGSSLKYPSTFQGEVRSVYLEGEAYFEVAKKHSMPFIVHSAKQDIVVLGTHFNVNAYHDEPVVQTSLIEGLVEVKDLNSNKIKRLKPGDKSVLSMTSFKVKQEDVSNDIAWVDGDFVFEKESLASVLRKIGRWYNVEIVCSKNLDNLSFTGAISRSKKLSDVVEVLETTEQIKLKLVEGRLIVLD